MKNKSFVLLLLFVLIFALGLSACGEEAVEPTAPVAPEATPTPPSTVPDVDFGDTKADAGTESLCLEKGAYDFALVLENLGNLPQLKSLEIKGLSPAQVKELTDAYPGIELTYSLQFLGAEISSQQQEIDLSHIGENDLEAAAELLSALPNVTRVELQGAGIGMEGVKRLKAAAPQAGFGYSFSLFGKEISTDDERVEFEDTPIGNEGEEQIRLALDIMNNCSYFKLDDCGIDSTVMASIRDDYPDTKVVWRVYFNYFNCLTDEQSIRAIFDLNDTNSHELKYCTEVKYIDIGHNDILSDVSFVEYMPNLEIMILSGSLVEDLSPFANCPNLEFLELVWCSRVKDLSPLENCGKLKFVNLSYTQVEDLSPLMDKPLERFVYFDSRISAEGQAEFTAAHSDCWVSFDGKNPYIAGWRYNDDGGYEACEMYSKVRRVLGYDYNFYNHKGAVSPLDQN